MTWPIYIPSKSRALTAKTPRLLEAAAIPYSDDLHTYVAVISSSRTQNVAKMTELIGCATWYVPPDQVPAYQAAVVAAGGGSLVVPGGLVGEIYVSRNRALEDAWTRGQNCIQLDDDLRSLKMITHAEKRPNRVVAHTVPATFEEVLRYMAQEMAASGARLGGVALTTNLLNYNPARPVATAHFVSNGILFIKPCGVWYDGQFILKEDYDYTLQHLATYGVVARCDRVIADFQNRTNPGGAQQIRSDDLEDANIARLKAKWGACIVDHPRRPHEVLLKWQPPTVFGRKEAARGAGVSL